MGIYDRDYMDTGSKGSGPLGWSQVTWLIVINAAVYVLQHFVLNSSVNFRDWFALSQPGVLSGKVWQVLTFQFCHADPMHLIFNMILLFFLGRAAEQLFGARLVLYVYLIGGAVGGLLHLVWGFAFGASVLLGASASALALAMAVFCAIPEQSFSVLFLPVQVKAKHIAMVLLGINVLGFLGGLFGLSTSGNTSYLSHLGGMAVGFLFARRWWPNMKYGSSNGGGEVKASIAKRVKGKVQEKKAEKQKEEAAYLNGKVDAILEKISENGMQSLSAEEKRILERSSQKLSKKLDDRGKPLAIHGIARYWMSAAVETTPKQKRAALVLLLLLGVLALYFGRGLGGVSFISGDSSAWMPQDTAESRLFDRFSKRFGAIDMLLVSWEGCAVDDPVLSEVSAEIESRDAARAKASGQPRFFETVIDYPSLKASLLSPSGSEVELDKSLRQRTEGFLVGRDGQAGAIVLEGTAHCADNRPDALQLVLDVCEAKLGKEAQIRLGGPTFLAVSASDTTRRTLLVVAPMVAGLGLVVLLVMMRHVQMAMVCFITSGVAALYSVAAIDLAGEGLGDLLVIVPSLAQLLAMSNSIHFFNYYTESYREQGNASMRLATCDQSGVVADRGSSAVDDSGICGSSFEQS